MALSGARRWFQGGTEEAGDGGQRDPVSGLVSEERRGREVRRNQRMEEGRGAMEGEGDRREEKGGREKKGRGKRGGICWKRERLREATTDRSVSL